MQQNKLINGLWLCLTLFVFRVLGQLMSYYFTLPYLPEFSFWYSGAVSYPILLGWQIIIIILMTLFAYRFTTNQVKASLRAGQLLRIIGLIYFTTMFIRLIIGLFELSDQLWFNRPIPSFFHMVLASYLLLASHYHIQNTQEK